MSSPLKKNENPVNGAISNNKLNVI